MLNKFILIDTKLIIFFIHIVFTSFMVGVIWVIQIVHYPAFHFINKKKYINFQKLHMDKVSIIVVPAMIIELITSVILVYNETPINIILITSFVLLLVIWIITGIVFTKIHQVLQSGYQQTIVKGLVKMNWIRTVLWTLRLFLLMVYFIYEF